MGDNDNNDKALQLYVADEHNLIWSILNLKAFSPKPELLWGKVSVHVLILYFWNTYYAEEMCLSCKKEKWGSGIALNQGAY